MKTSYVYIMTTQRKGTRYVGTITDLVKRVWEHKAKIVLGFTQKYNLCLLVYYEVHESVLEAARRERRFTNWCRQWKINLIVDFNPAWRDLYKEICS